MPGNAWRRASPSRGRPRRTGSPTSSSCARASTIPQRRCRDRRGREVLLRAVQGRGGDHAEGARGRASRSSTPHRVRFRLKQPWPDFMTFYATPATGAAWIVPKKYVERVGDDGFKKAPIGAGPYRFVSFNPGVELVLEAYEGYWRKTPAVKRLVFKSVPDESTRLAMLKRGEADIAYSIRGPIAEEVQADAGPHPQGRRFPTFTEWLVFTEQWDPKSPWADRRVRLAANLAIDRKAINEAEYLGFGKSASSIIPRDFEFCWPPPALPVRPGAGEAAPGRGRLPEGLRRGRGRDRRRLRARGRGRHQRAPGGSASAPGCGRSSAPPSTRRTRRSSSSTSSASAARRRRQRGDPDRGVRDHGRHPRLRRLPRHRRALPRAGRARWTAKRREALLHKIQQLMHERAMFAPIVEPPFLNGVGPRLAEVPTISGHPYSRRTRT